MSRSNTARLARNKVIHELYSRYASEYITGSKGQKIQKYRHLAILEMVAKKVFLEPTTVGNILNQPEEDNENPNQLDLFIPSE